MFRQLFAKTYRLAIIHEIHASQTTTSQTSDRQNRVAKALPLIRSVKNDRLRQWIKYYSAHVYWQVWWCAGWCATRRCLCSCVLHGHRRLPVSKHYSYCSWSPITWRCRSHRLSVASAFGLNCDALSAPPWHGANPAAARSTTERHRP